MANVTGKHRSIALAERHLRALSRENPGADVRIASRRNSLGHHSKNGHIFYFEIKKKRKIKPPPEPPEPPEEEFEEIELVGGFDSPGRKKK